MDIYWILVALVFLVGVPIQPYLSKARAKIYLWIVFLNAVDSVWLPSIFGRC